MKVKLLEVRDEGTFIPVFAFQVIPENAAQSYLVRRCGYNVNPPSIMLGILNGERPATADPYFWGNRTLCNAHQHIIDSWDNLVDGDVVDVQFILGESTTKKLSERVTSSFGI